MDMMEKLDEGLAAVSVTFFAACAFVLVVVSNQFSEWANTFFKEVVIAMEKEIETMQRELDAKDALSPVDAPPSSTQPSALEQGTDTLIRAGAQGEQSGTGVLQLLRFVDGYKDRRSEFLLFRQRFIQRANCHGGWNLPGDFKFSEYLSNAASARLREVVSLEPAELLGLWALVLSIFLAVEAAPAAVAAVSAAAGQPDQQAMVLPLLFALSQAVLCGWVAVNVLVTDHLIDQLLPVSPSLHSAEAQTRGLLPPRYVGDDPERDDADPARRQALLERHEGLFASPLWSAEAGQEVLQSSIKLALFASVISLACGVPLLGGVFWRESPGLVAAVFLPPVAGILTTPKVT
jgi:hypothetical protein